MTSLDNNDEMDNHITSFVGNVRPLSLAKEQESFVHLARDAFIIPGVSSVTMANAHLSSNQIEMLVMAKYEFIELLGRGASAEVHRVVQIRTGQQLAMKIIRRDNHMNDTETMSGEAASLLALRKQQQLHQLTPLSSNYQHVAGLVELFAGKDALFLVTRLAQHGGDMLHLLGHTIPSLNAEAVYSERDVSLLFRQLLIAMSNIHSAGIVHRDLKFENVLYTLHKENKLDDYHRYHGVEILVADFGLSAPPGHVSALPRSLLSLPSFHMSDYKTNKDRSKPYTKQSKRLREMWGTMAYFAPELLTGKGYGSQADSWSLGCLLVEMLTGDLAFTIPEEQEDIGHWLDRMLNEQEKVKRSFELLAGWKEQALSAEARHLVAGLLNRNPKRRLSVEEALLHPFISGEASISNSQPLPVAASKLQEQWHQRETKRLQVYEKLISLTKKLEAQDRKCSLKIKADRLLKKKLAAVKHKVIGGARI